MWKILPVLLLFAVPLCAQEQGTAYDALRVLGNQLGRNSVNHIVSITGVDGSPQPERWKILLDDGREIEVAGDSIVSDRTMARAVTGSSEGATINTARLNLDSTGAYAVASHTADKSGTQFATANYTLRTDERGNAVWIVTLQGSSGRPVGIIYVGANRGNVTRTEGMFAGATMEDVATSRDFEPVDEGVRGVLKTTKSSISHGFYVAQHEARGMFERVKRSFSDFINGE